MDKTLHIPNLFEYAGSHIQLRSLISFHFFFTVKDGKKKRILSRLTDCLTLLSSPVHALNSVLVRPSNVHIDRSGYLRLRFHGTWAHQ